MNCTLKRETWLITATNWADKEFLCLTIFVSIVHTQKWLFKKLLSTLFWLHFLVSGLRFRRRSRRYALNREWVKKPRHVYSVMALILVGFEQPIGSFRSFFFSSSFWSYQSSIEKCVCVCVCVYWRACVACAWTKGEKWNTGLLNFSVFSTTCFCNEFKGDKRWADN